MIEKKENEALCSMSLQTYSQTTDTLKMVKITALVGSVADGRHYGYS